MGSFRKELTPSRCIALGVDRSTSSASSIVILGWHGAMVKAQKFMAFTGKTYWTQGFGRVSGTASSGSARLRPSSSSAVNFHTINSLSLPWLSKSGQQQPLHIEKSAKNVTYVMSRSEPHSPMPRIVFSCARQTARARMMVRSHTTTKPSASPVTRRELFWMKRAAWTCDLWPRRMALGWGGPAEAMAGSRRRGGSYQLG